MKLIHFIIIVVLVWGYFALAKPVVLHDKVVRHVDTFAEWVYGIESMEVISVEQHRTIH